MMSRSGISRLETRSTRANRDELVKRVMLTVERVRKWEKKWVDAGIDGCTLKTYKWVPVAKDEMKQVKNTLKDNLSANISDVSSTTSSPLPMEENNLNSVNISVKPNDRVHKQPPHLLTNSSSGEPSRHSGIYARSDKTKVSHMDRLFSEEEKAVENLASSNSAITKMLQERDDGEDSNHAPSIASEDSTSLMYHLGMNVGGENDDSRQSFQSATDSENSAENNRKSPLPTTSKDWRTTGSSFNSNLTASNTERIIMHDEPPTKRPREDPICHQ